MEGASEPTPGLRERKRRETSERIIEKGLKLFVKNGYEATTLDAIAEAAGISRRTFFYYFKSKEELSIAVMELVMDRLGARIRKVTETLNDPGQLYAFGCRTVMQVASRDPRWRWLLKRTDVLADAMIRAFGRYGRDDMRQAIKAGRYKVENEELAWRMTIWCLVGVSVNLHNEQLSVVEAEAVIDAAVVNILCMLGMDQAEAKIAVGGLPRQLEPEDASQKPQTRKTRSPNRRNEQYAR